MSSIFRLSSLRAFERYVIYDYIYIYMPIYALDAQAPHPNSASGWNGGMKLSPSEPPWSETLGRSGRGLRILASSRFPAVPEILRKIDYTRHRQSAEGAQGRHARIIRELPRHKAIESLVMREANAAPGQVEVAAAQTSEKRRSQRRDRSSQTPIAVTASGTNRTSVDEPVAVSRLSYFVTLWL